MHVDVAFERNDCLLWVSPLNAQLYVECWVSYLRYSGYKYRLVLPLSQTIPADEEQYGMLIEQLMDPLNGGPQWPYYFRRSYGTPSDGLVWEAGNDITELVIFRATPHFSFPPTNYHSFPPFDYQGAGSGNGDATHIIERDHHGDGKQRQHLAEFLLW